MSIFVSSDRSFRKIFNQDSVMQAFNIPDNYLDSWIIYEEDELGRVLDSLNDEIEVSGRGQLICNPVNIVKKKFENPQKTWIICNLCEIFDFIYNPGFLMSRKFVKIPYDIQNISYVKIDNELFFHLGLQ